MKKLFFISALFVAVGFSNHSLAQNAAPAAEVTMKVGTYDVRYSVNGRLITNTPKVDIMSEEHGIVVVDIVVDKYGNVISATPGGKGSTTTSKYLLTKAKQCAESARYDSKPTSPLKTSGTFTITF